MGKYKSENTGDYKAMASVEIKQMESNMVTTRVINALACDY